VQTSNRTEKFISDWLAAAAGFSVLVELSADNDRCIRIKQLRAWPKDKSGQSEASRALETLCDLADLHGIALCGEAMPYGKHAEEAIRLRLWLARFGFEPSDPTIVVDELYRAPKQTHPMPAAQA
jgi:hypothetical protein